MLGTKPEEPKRHPIEPYLIDFAEHFSCYDLLLGFDTYIRHRVKNILVLVYFGVIWLSLMSFSLFLGFNWVFSIVALAMESYGTTERAFYICTIASFFAWWVSNNAMFRYQKRWSIKGNLGEFNVVAILFVTSMILGIITKDEIDEPFGQIVFWTYATMSCYAGFRGSHKMFIDIFHVLE